MPPNILTENINKLNIYEDNKIPKHKIPNVENVNQKEDSPRKLSQIEEENGDNGGTAYENELSSEESESDNNVPVTTESYNYNDPCFKHNLEILFYCKTHSCRICKGCTVKAHPNSHCTVITSEEEITDIKLHHEDELNGEIRKCAEFFTLLQKKKAYIETEESRHESLALLLGQERELVLGILEQAQGNKRRMEACKREISLSETREDVEMSCANSCDVVADMKLWQKQQEDRIMDITTAEDTVLLIRHAACNQITVDSSKSNCEVIYCTNKCGLKFLRCQLDEHLLLCCQQLVPCINKIYGCKSTIRRGLWWKHKSECSAMPSVEVLFLSRIKQIGMTNNRNA